MNRASAVAPLLVALAAFGGSAGLAACGGSTHRGTAGLAALSDPDASRQEVVGAIRASECPHPSVEEHSSEAPSYTQISCDDDRYWVFDNALDMADYIDQHRSCSSVDRFVQGPRWFAGSSGPNLALRLQRLGAVPLACEPQERIPTDSSGSEA